MAILGSAMLAYVAGIVCDKTTKYKKCGLFVYVLLQLGILFGFKYQFFLDLLPTMAISFYLLSCIGYVVDVYRGKYEAQKNVLKLVAALFFFPTLLQGPICRYDDMLGQYSKAKYDSEKIAYGLTRICYGVMKKLVIADRLVLVFEALRSMDNGMAIAFNIIVYAFYLYANFSSGIDIAIGIGYLFGITLPENFNNPFLAKSISDYWRRWHMSLGTWLRDYIFYPVSFSKPVVKLSKWVRKKFGYRASKKVPIYIATVIVWFVTGVWHGVNKNFILWGLLNGFIILSSIELEPLYKKFNEKCLFTQSKIYNAFRVVRTFILMGILRMLDYSTVSGYISSLIKMVTDFKMSDISYVSEALLDKADMIILILGLLLMFIASICKEKSDYNKLVYSKGVVLTYAVIAILIMITIVFGMYGIGYEAKDFIYIKY